MTEYRRDLTKGGTYFFTVCCAERQANTLLTENVEILRSSFRRVKRRHPFSIDAIVVLPDHLHCIWTLPEGDADYGVRWSLIKAAFSRGLPKTECLTASRQLRGERGLWQRRFWEHRLRDQPDFNRHADYIHWNPVKHGLVDSAKAWPYSSFHRYVERGVYSENWGGGLASTVNGGE
ncbi:REP-associated tyrosine transposase [Marinobacter sp. SS21]|uniref:REP-associated tyrosine transposase n=1 Tax=Marinobacter sp. SS21 TaxID=2979460 RepID=UPI00232AC7EB|nr:transposase [Marinobacter sp. SS21]MDC0664188.1 transposase [Marinobacter sp. SS21]